MSELLLRAFQALGSSPTRREIALVAKARRESRDEETLAMFPDEGGFDGLGAVTAMAERADAGAFVALDRGGRTWGPNGAGAAAGSARQLKT